MIVLRHVDASLLLSCIVCSRHQDNQSLPCSMTEVCATFRQTLFLPVSARCQRCRRCLTVLPATCSFSQFVIFARSAKGTGVCLDDRIWASHSLCHTMRIRSGLYSLCVYVSIIGEEKDRSTIVVLALPGVALFLAPPCYNCHNAPQSRVLQLLWRTGRYGAAPHFAYR